jgi:hypothetical protein
VLDDGSVYVSESNFRRTGGTYLDSIVKRLRKGQGSNVFWAADVKNLFKMITFEDAVTRLHEIGIAYNKDRGTGVILTADTFDSDCKLRYLVVDTSAERTIDTERRLLTGFMISE